MVATCYRQTVCESSRSAVVTLPNCRKPPEGGGFTQPRWGPQKGVLMLNMRTLSAATRLEGTRSSAEIDVPSRINPHDP